MPPEDIAPFDYMDEFYVLNHLSIQQLRREISTARHYTDLIEHEYERITIVDGKKHSEYITTLDTSPCIELTFPYRAWGLLCQRCLDQLLKRRPAANKNDPRHVDIEAVKQRADIIEVVGRYVQLKKSGTRFAGLCPFHSDKSPSMVVYPRTQSFYCFGCQTSGDVLDFVEKIEHTDFRGAAAILERV